MRQYNTLLRSTLKVLTELGGTDLDSATEAEAKMASLLLADIKAKLSDLECEVGDRLDAFNTDLNTSDEEAN